MDEYITPVKMPDVSTPYDSDLLSKSPHVHASNQTELFPDIDNTNRNFKGQQKNEIVYCFSRKHWILLVPHFIGLLTIIGLIIGYFSMAPVLSGIKQFLSAEIYHAIIFILLCMVTFFLHSFFIRVFNYYLQIFIITNFRIVELGHTLYFTRDSDSIHIDDIQEIEVHQNGIVRTIFNYGDLVMTLSSGYATNTVHYVPNPHYYFRKITKTQRQDIYGNLPPNGVSNRI